VDARVTEVISRYIEAYSALKDVCDRREAWERAERAGAQIDDDFLAEEDRVHDETTIAVEGFVDTVPTNARSLAKMLRRVREDKFMADEMRDEENSRRLRLSIEKFACAAAGLPVPSGDLEVQHA